MGFETLPKPNEQNDEVSYEAELVIEALRAAAHNADVGHEGINFVHTKAKRTKRDKKENHIDPILQTELWVSEMIFKVIRLKYPNFNPDLDHNSEKISLILNDSAIKALQKNVANTILLSNRELFFIIDKVVARILEDQK